jgi:CRP/FNR family transcriptional regulator, cyclic AMP receptor protein
MSLNEEVELLRNIPIFARIEPAKLKLLAFASERITYSDGQELFSEGDPGDAAYIIMEGEAEVIVGGPAAPIKVATMKRNDIVGEIAILCDVPRTATVRAVGTLVTLKIAKDLFYRLVTEFPQMAVEIMRELAHRLERMNVQLRETYARQAGIGKN